MDNSSRQVFQIWKLIFQNVDVFIILFNEVVFIIDVVVEVYWKGIFIIIYDCKI